MPVIEVIEISLSSSQIEDLSFSFSLSKMGTIIGMANALPFCF